MSLVVSCRVVRRAEELATRSPLGAWGGAVVGHRSVSRTGTGPRKAVPRPFARLACVPGHGARECRGPSRRAARHRPSPPTVPVIGHSPEDPRLSSLRPQQPQQCRQRQSATQAAASVSGLRQQPEAAASGSVRSRTFGAVPRTSGVRAGSPPGGRRASRRHRSRTPSVRSARAGIRPDAAPRTS